MKITALNHLFPTLVSLVIIDCCITIYFRADILILQFLEEPDEQIGLFSAALRLVEAFILLWVPIRGIFQTEIRKGNNEANKDLKNIVHTICYAAIVGSIMSICLYVFSENLILYLFGANYQDASKYLKILCWLLIPSCMLAVVSEVVVARELEKQYRYLTIVIATMTINLIFIVNMAVGFEGVVYLKVILEIIFALSGSLLLLLYFRRKLLTETKI